MSLAEITSLDCCVTEAKTNKKLRYLGGAQSSQKGKLVARSLCCINKRLFNSLSGSMQTDTVGDLPSLQLLTTHSDLPPPPQQQDRNPHSPFSHGDAETLQLPKVIIDCDRTPCPRTVPGTTEN